MKKSLIVIALALLMIVPVFAAYKQGTNGAELIYATSANEEPVSKNGTDESTKVTLTLNLNPKYVFGISTSKYVSANITTDKTKETTTVIYYENLPAVSEIQMTKDEENLTFGSPSGTYYISYWFRDYNQSCTLTASIDQDLTLQDGGKNATYATDEADEYTIKYQATITPESAVSGETNGYSISGDNVIYSSGSTKSIEVSSCTKTDLLGQVICGNLKIVLAPVQTTGTNNVVTSENSIANKKQGSYLSHIILTLKAV